MSTNSIPLSADAHQNFGGLRLANTSSTQALNLASTKQAQFTTFNIEDLLAQSGISKDEGNWLQKNFLGTQWTNTRAQLRASAAAVNKPDLYDHKFKENLGFRYDASRNTIAFANSAQGAQAFMRFLRKLEDFSTHSNGTQTDGVKKFSQTGLALMVNKLGPVAQAELRNIYQKTQAQNNDPLLNGLSMVNTLMSLLPARLPMRVKARQANILRPPQVGKSSTPTLQRRPNTIPNSSADTANNILPINRKGSDRYGRGTIPPKNPTSRKPAVGPGSGTAVSAENTMRLTKINQQVFAQRIGQKQLAALATANRMLASNQSLTVGGKSVGVRDFVQNGGLWIINPNLALKKTGDQITIFVPQQESAKESIGTIVRTLTNGSMDLSGTLTAKSITGRLSAPAVRPSASVEEDWQKYGRGVDIPFFPKRTVSNTEITDKVRKQIDKIKIDEEAPDGGRCVAERVMRVQDGSVMISNRVTAQTAQTKRAERGQNPEITWRNDPNAVTYSESRTVMFTSDPFVTVRASAIRDLPAFAGGGPFTHLGRDKTNDQGAAVASNFGAPSTANQSVTPNRNADDSFEGKLEVGRFTSPAMGDGMPPVTKVITVPMKPSFVAPATRENAKVDVEVSNSVSGYCVFVKPKGKVARVKAKQIRAGQASQTAVDVANPRGHVKMKTNQQRQNVEIVGPNSGLGPKGSDNLNLNLNR
jgi:hypothetical protein